MSDSHIAQWIVEAVLKFVVFPLLLAGVGWCGYRFKRRASRSWQLATGTVESAKVRYEGDSVLTKRWILDTSYSYRVNGDWYSGFGEDRFETEEEADAAASGLKHRPLAIRYNPKSPDQSVPV